MSDGLAVMSLFREGARAWRSVVGVGAPPVWRGLFSVWWCASDEGIKIDDAFVRVLGDVFDYDLSGVRYFDCGHDFLDLSVLYELESQPAVFGLMCQAPDILGIGSNLFHA